MVLIENGKFSKVISFLHRLENVDANFVRLYYEINISSKHYSHNYVTMTPLHLIQAQTSEGFKYIPAKEIKPGDFLKHYDRKQNSFIYARVRHIEPLQINKSGIYSPLTESGTIVVDDIHVSCFSVVKNHQLTSFVFNLFNWGIGISNMDLFFSADELFVKFSVLLFKFSNLFGLTKLILNV